MTAAQAPLRAAGLMPVSTVVFGRMTLAIRLATACTLSPVAAYRLPLPALAGCW